MVAARAARVKVGRLEDRTDPQRRVLELGVGPVEQQRRAARRRSQAEQHAQRRRLPGAIGAEEARDRARLEHERQTVNRQDAAEPLRQRVGYDDSRHAIAESAGAARIMREL
jgi:hypothetical protein